MKILNYITAILISVLLCGCAGTVCRFEGAGRNVKYDDKSDNPERYALTGKPIFPALIIDFKVAGDHTSANWFYPASNIFFAVSMPMDLCFDVIFLPLDLITWPMGCKNPGSR